MKVFALWDGDNKPEWKQTHRYSSWEHFRKLAFLTRARFLVQGFPDGSIHWRKVFPVTIMSSSVFRFDWEGDCDGAEAQRLAAMRVLMGGEL